MSQGSLDVHRRDVVGQKAVDFEDRLDVSRLKRERLARLRAQIVQADLGGLLLYDPLNIIYATGLDRAGVFWLRMCYRYALVPRVGTPILFGGRYFATDGSVEARRGLGWEFFGYGRNVQEGARRWAADLAGVMRERGMAGERLGIDRLDFVGFEALRGEGIALADARVPVERARAIKTVDELILLRQACAVADVASSAVQDALRPGVTEDELFAILAATNIRFGGEHMSSRNLSAGGNTHPWGRGSTDRIVRAGDLVAFDTDMAGPLNYMADISRTYLCGNVRPTPEQKEAYKVAYDFLQQSLPLFRPGASLREIAEKAPPFPDAYKARRYGWMAHGVGMADEWPSIYFPDVSDSGFGNDPDVLEENMVMCLEALAGRFDGRENVKLEEQLIITASGPEVISLAPYDLRLLD